jgi:FixJ family two-component response regulator
MPDEVQIPSYLNRDRLVHIADGDLRTCEELSILFRIEGFQTVFSADAVAFAAALERRRPDVVVASTRLGGEATVALLQRVKALKSGTAIFMMLDIADVGQAVDAMKAGAADVLTKPIDGEQLLSAVREALRREAQPAPPRTGRRSFEIRGFDQLTPREREVLQLITNGQSNKEAGRELGISPRTIEVHRARVMEKLGARNTADLMRIVLAG